MTEPTFTLTQLKELQEIFLKHDTSPANALGTKVPHGLQADGHPFAGLFFNPGSEPDVYSTMVRPDSIGPLLLAPKMTDITNPQFDLVTGVQAGRGSNASNICDSAPKAGLVKVGTTTAQFGIMRLDTDVGEIPTTGGRVNQADVNKQFINLMASANPLLPDILRNPGDINDLLAMQLFALGVQIERSLETVLFQGNKATASASTALGFIREFDGFDQLIATDYVDAITNTAITSAYSLIESWGSTDVSGTITRNLRSYNIVQVLTEMYFILKRRAEAQGLAPVQWAIAMHPDLFRALSREWACSYLTSGCVQTAPGSGAFVVDAASSRQLMDQMYRGRYLLMEGEQVPVVFSEGMANAQFGAGWRSDIYFIPLTARGVRVTYLEGFNQGNPSAEAWAGGLVGENDYRVTNGGLYAFASSRTRFCKQYHMVAQPRLIMRTPFLAARLTNVAYRNFLYQDDPYPTGIYHRDGGVTQRYAPTPFSN